MSTGETPWRVLSQRQGADFLEISDEGGLVLIAQVFGNKRAQRAALIVEAVNSYQALTPADGGGK